jgi:hypothetical protein
MTGFEKMASASSNRQSSSAVTTFSGYSSPPSLPKETKSLVTAGDDGIQ